MNMEYKLSITVKHNYYLSSSTTCFGSVNHHQACNKSKGVLQQAKVAQGVPGRLRPRIFLAFRHYKGGTSSAKRTSCLYRRRNPWYSLSEAASTSGHMVLSRAPRKKFPVTPPDCPTSSAVP